ncbi:hypothetical protein [Endozoicomonas sp. SCSIO W0465]|uniref:hypothetical protein n=1 Tax=Endozoicomonas sp. SCSIO W0465 TaxID=2918516 RepID=UPI0020763FF5|nr:hypothetical protein [Endozoicomonas sp. SCSIO W0465]USE36068.1 hypothetical protein MJO57_29150 [Endozoicomonas sp. SCSIO W0465]
MKKAEICEKLLENLHPGCDVLADLATEALELMAEKSSWAGRRVNIDRVGVVRYRITDETPCSGLRWHQDPGDTSLVVQMNRGVGYQGGGLNTGQQGEIPLRVVEET